MGQAMGATHAPGPAAHPLPPRGTPGPPAPRRRGTLALCTLAAAALVALPHPVPPGPWPPRIAPATPLALHRAPGPAPRPHMLRGGPRPPALLRAVASDPDPGPAPTIPVPPPPGTAAAAAMAAAQRSTAPPLRALRAMCDLVAGAPDGARAAEALRRLAQHRAWASRAPARAFAPVLVRLTAALEPLPTALRTPGDLCACMRALAIVARRCPAARAWLRTGAGTRAMQALGWRAVTPDLATRLSGQQVARVLWALGQARAQEPVLLRSLGHLLYPRVTSLTAPELAMAVGGLAHCGGAGADPQLLQALAAQVCGLGSCSPS